MKKRFRVLFMSFGLSLYSFCSMATQFVPPHVLLRVEFQSLAHHRSKVVILNEEKEPIEIRIRQGLLSKLEVPDLKARLNPQESQELLMSLNFASEAMTTIHLQSEITLLDQNLNVPGPGVFEVVKLTGSQAQRVSYSDAFLSRRLRPKDFALERNLFRSCNQEMCHDLFFETQPVSEDLDFMITPRSSLEESEPRSAQEVSSSAGQKKVQLRGRLFFKMTSRRYHSAEKMLVSAWVFRAGFWTKMGSSFVQSDGSWVISGLPQFLGLTTRVVYQSQNEFFSLNDPNHRPYAWSDSTYVLGENTQLGSRFIDLSLNGNLPGLDEVYLGALELWVKFQLNGISLARPSPIEVVFPNSLSTHECILTNNQGPYPWSCSYWGDGKIYIIPEHAHKSVIQHELAHSIHSFFWGGKMPQGVGGEHNLWECFHPGLALTEGFADFIAYWVQFERQAQDPHIDYFNMNLETLPQGVCPHAGSEMRVASTLWDIYDTHVDGSDSQKEFDHVMSEDPAASVKIFLGNPQDTMPEYLRVFQRELLLPHPEDLEHVFRLDKMLSSSFYLGFVFVADLSGVSSN